MRKVSQDVIEEALIYLYKSLNIKIDDWYDIFETDNILKLRRYILKFDIEPVEKSKPVSLSDLDKEIMQYQKIKYPTPNQKKHLQYLLDLKNSKN